MAVSQSALSYEYVDTMPVLEVPLWCVVASVSIYMVNGTGS